ncbi:pyridoxal-5'-phosphate-dependent protein subunit beta [Burkholderia ubonensis]|uniref:pyridoxal-phosphate dependent enzyme n=1 Tax=Burkholderia ubonensis TaxID=101571 RepID=UPI00075AF9A0|nr:pyridoxal-phosphate dependent enzyme [Burkholderia ubonensis]AYZ66598.1 pyridoxal-phosphate dependent enzyme [Burkholderia multivorans]AOI71771.1 pyridoxal-5'-phosphate-dependent protein subunit beta [Burkholderia ubonensis]KUZ19924.1 pyridoxal-5'-phosphate-dependent protein subunit beta [Burkholderia ubonensis]KUZ36436.1 pyridoxal-5'-phosphate-dependent protein subunit beta [Burkholderia ubonensis]KUZ40009.1 pyridoxal-5'-phosphate-dependent protein subunit beta [Burkholderia ubonensis]
MSSRNAAALPCAWPTLGDIRQAAARLRGKVLETPVWQWRTGPAVASLAPATEVWLKLELFQITGTFKLRGALNCIEALSAAERARGVVAASAGNHAVAVAYAARVSGTQATLLMSRHASPARIDACRSFGAHVILTEDIHEAFSQAREIELRDARAMVPAFDGPRIAEGTGTIGLELLRQIDGLDAVIVPVGGGGLSGGIAAAVKQLAPHCAVYGAEPTGADTMHRSFASGRPERLLAMTSIADSLGAPHASAYTYALCRRYLDDVVQIDDAQLAQAVYWLFRDMKLALEPAAAAATAALFGPLRERLAGKRVALIVCGSNLTPDAFARYAAMGMPAARAPEPRIEAAA